MEVLLLVPSLLLVGIVFWLLDAQKTEREDWSKERKDLLNRIQVPEAAPYMEVTPTKSHVDFDSDSDFWAAREEAMKAADG